MLTSTTVESRTELEALVRLSQVNFAPRRCTGSRPLLTRNSGLHIDGRSEIETCIFQSALTISDVQELDVRVSNVDAAGDRCPAAAPPSDDMWAASPATRNHGTGLQNSTQLSHLDRMSSFN